MQKAEHQRIDAFEKCGEEWRRLFRVPWTARRSNQSILKEIHPEYALEGLMLKLKLQQFGHLMWRTDLLEKTLMLGKTEGRRTGNNRVWDGWMASPTQWTWVWASPRRWWRIGKPGVVQSMRSQSLTGSASELNWTGKLGISKEEWPSQKGYKLIFKPHSIYTPVQPRRLHRYAKT